MTLPLTFFLWSLSVWEGAESEGHRGERGLSKEKGETPGPWISNCLSRELSLCTMLGFRGKKDPERGRGWGLEKGAESPAGRGWGA